MYIASLIPLYPSASEIFQFSVLGFSVVMIVLAILSIITACVGFFFKLYDNKQAQKAQKAKEAQAPKVEKVKNIADIANPEHAYVVSAAVAAVMADLKPENAQLIAVLSAAATVALGDDCSVVSFKEVPNMAYSYQGRQQLYSSKMYRPTRVK